MILQLLFLSTLLVSTSQAQLIESLYCGTRNCYHVLGVRRTASTSELSQAYHTLSRVYHPDRNTGDDSRKTYDAVVTAYDTLINDGKRKDYNYLLDYPEKVYYHYYQYYNRRYSPNFNVRGLILVSIIIYSVCQYLYQSYTLSEGVKYALKRQRNHYKQLIETDESLAEMKRQIKNKKGKEEYKKLEEQVLRELVERDLTATGEFSRPDIKNTLFIQILFSPYYFARNLKWHIVWYRSGGGATHSSADEEEEGAATSDIDKLVSEKKEAFLKNEMDEKQRKSKKNLRKVALHGNIEIVDEGEETDCDDIKMVLLNCVNAFFKFIKPYIRMFRKSKRKTFRESLLSKKMK